MRVHWLQHADHEGLGCIGPWLAAHGHPAGATRLYAGERPPPNVSGFDALIAMGGPMNVDEHERHPWLVPEKALIRAALDAGKRVLGICLGAQLIARALGAEVARNPEAEIGWFPVRLSEAGRAAPLLADLPNEFTAFHWHGDTYALPAGAELLASSEACAQQAFTCGGGRVLGLQFHLEVGKADAQLWFANDAPTPARYVQTPEMILAQDEGFDANNRFMRSILARFFD